MTARITLFLGCAFLATSLHAEILSVGFKAGVPLTDAFETAKGNSDAWASKTHRYTIGPTVELHLPARFSIEVDALYTRVGFDHSSSDPTQPYFSATSANSWSFPVLGKFEILPGPIRPFLDLGPSFRHITGVKQVRTVISAGTFQTVEVSNPPEFNKETDTGLTFGGGIAFKAGPVRLSPEFRYTRWGGENFRDPIHALLRTSRNDGTFLLGFTF